MSMKYLLLNMVCGTHDQGEVYRYGCSFDKEDVSEGNLLEHINFSDNRLQITGMNPKASFGKSFRSELRGIIHLPAYTG